MAIELVATDPYVDTLPIDFDYKILTDPDLEIFNAAIAAYTKRMKLSNRMHLSDYVLVKTKNNVCGIPRGNSKVVYCTSEWNHAGNHHSGRSMKLNPNGEFHHINNQVKYNWYDQEFQAALFPDKYFLAEKDISRLTFYNNFVLSWVYGVYKAHTTGYRRNLLHALMDEARKIDPNTTLDLSIFSYDKFIMLVDFHICFYRGLDDRYNPHLYPYRNLNFDLMARVNDLYENVAPQLALYISSVSKAYTAKYG